MAQAYNHMILPLADSKDKYTQVLWGIRDFEHHFGRVPEGMWLPETAVDMETLDIMSQLGIKFTILAPYQAKRFRLMTGQTWIDARNGIDTTQAYRVSLPSGSYISLFFTILLSAVRLLFRGFLPTGKTLPSV